MKKSGHSYLSRPGKSNFQKRIGDTDDGTMTKDSATFVQTFDFAGKNVTLEARTVQH